MKHCQALRAISGVTEVTEVTNLVVSEYIYFPFARLLLRDQV